MIQLPPGFNAAQLLSDFFAFATPFLSISMLFGVAAIIRKSINQAGR
ncbi:hypothetical protein [Trichlorobacter ammonificans]|nr:hypothetical protein [Trichlorobacter ammonificans]